MGNPEQYGQSPSSTGIPERHGQARVVWAIPSSEQAETRERGYRETGIKRHQGYFLQCAFNTSFLQALR
jgi:hypothetical protein